MSSRRLVVVLLLTLASVATVAVPASAGVPEERLGLHVTATELAAWRDRAVDGPFHTKNDVAPNSPGDWSRIVKNAATFRAAPAAHRWGGTTDLSGCVDGTANTDDDPTASSTRYLRDAAFAALVTEDTGLRKLAARELLAQSRVRTLDFANRSHWCLGSIMDLNPGFELANWLTTLLYTFEYVEIGDRLTGTATLTAAERRELLDWMWAAAEWMNHDNNAKLDSNFKDRSTRPGPPYTLSDHRAETPDFKAEPFHGEGMTLGAVGRYYNNRRASLARYVGLLGLHVLHRGDGYTPPAGSLRYTPERLVADSTRFARDYLVYSAYPKGYVAEFQRALDRLPDLGWVYGIQAFAPVMTFVDALARTGDTSLYEFTTTAGAHFSQGAPAGASAKSWRWLVDSLHGYLDGTSDRYMSGHPGDPAYRIDGRNGSDWQSLHDLALVPTTRYWKDSRLAARFARTAPGMTGYPAQPASFGQYPVWNGDWGTLPGVLFMFGRMEAVPAPYSSAPDPVTVGPVPVPPPTGSPTGVRKAIELTGVCPADALGAGFTDTAGNVHATAIDCVAGLGIALGAAPGRYVPAAAVTRGQMATFLARLIERAGGELPAGGSQGFADTVGSVHADNIQRLAAAGIVDGVASDRFAPAATVTRGQLASLLVRTLEHLGADLGGTPPNAFSDDDGSVHEHAIDVAAALGLVTGTAAGTVAAATAVRRDQVASFLARTLSVAATPTAAA